MQRLHQQGKRSDHKGKFWVGTVSKESTNTVSQDEDSKSDDEEDETMIHVLNMFQSEWQICI